MNSTLRVLLQASPFLLLAPGLVADDHTAAVTVRESSVQSGEHPGARIESARATELIGRKVNTTAGVPFAKIDDFLIDLENGRIVQVLITGEEAAPGRVEVPPRTFRYSKGDRVIQWRGDAAKLRTAPPFSPPGSNRPGQSVHAGEVYAYYGEEPYFVVTEAAPQPLNNVHTHGKVESAMMPVPMGRVILAGELIGLTVKDSADEKVGSVEDLIVDLPAGRVVALVISTGGFLGLGDSLNAVPPAVIRYVSEDKNELRVTVSKETLKSAPRYRAADADRFSDPAYTDEVYRSYQADPYSTVAGADNTRRNKRDRDGATLTPLDQGSLPVDVEITARIRRDVVAREDLSVNAKNVKIITRDGRVTLRGPVRTLAEKRDIEAIAIRAAGAADRVDSQLEVAAD
ncbi:MAG TPA: PRC-barrel domain-containing protein [Rariglobus sp.]